jgi:hypothetical protein
LLAEPFVAVGIGGVAGDLVAQDGLLLAAAEDYDASLAYRSVTGS